MKKLGILFGIIAILILVIGCVDIENTKKPFETKATSNQTANQTQASSTPTAQTDTLKSTNSTTSTTPTPTQTQTTPKSKGKVVFAVADEAVEIKDIQSVKLTVSAISVHNRGEWKLVSTTPVTQDLYLLKKNGEIGLLKEIELEEGNYDQVRLILSSVKITTRMGEGKNAEVPSNVLQLNGNVRVDSDKTSSVLVDFDLDKSVHKTGLGRFLFIPVVKYETKTDVTAGISGSTVSFSGGITVVSKKLGMNVEGETVEDYELSPNVELKYVDGKISEGSQTKVDVKILSSGLNNSISQNFQDASKEKVLGRYSRN